MKRCYGCFGEIGDSLEICPFCGYVEGTPAREGCLSPGTELANRYIVGKEIKTVENGVSYVAFDNSTFSKVSIVEYLPREIVLRPAGTASITVSDGDRAIFDDGLKAFIDKAKKIYKDGGPVKLFDCIAENGTAYMIVEYKEEKPYAGVFKNSNKAVDTGKSVYSRPQKRSYQEEIKPVEEPSIPVLKPNKKEDHAYNLMRKISLLPLWIKIVIPSVIVIAVAFAVLFSSGIISFKKDSDESMESIAETEETAIVLSVDADVLDFNGHSYACFGNCETWEDAEAYCESLDGHLAVITSLEENEAIYTFIKVKGYENVFIGYADSDGEGEWGWVNDEDSIFENWNPGEPNAFTENEDYAVFANGGNGTWNDSEFSSNGVLSFICEWDFRVNGTTNTDYAELNVNSVLSNDFNITTVITEEQAIQAFENYWNSQAAENSMSSSVRNSSWNYVGSLINTGRFDVSDDTGVVSSYYIDLNTGLSRRVTYEYLYSGDKVIDSIEQNVFQASDFNEEINSPTSDVSGYVLDDSEVYYYVMNYVDAYEVLYPGTQYAMTYQTYDGNGYWKLFTCDSFGYIQSYVVDELGLMEVDEHGTTCEFVSYDTFKSYPFLCDVFDHSNGADLALTGTISDGVYYGSLEAVSEDGEYALVFVSQLILYSDEDLNSLQPGDSINVGSINLTYSGVDDDDQICFENDASELYYAIEVQPGVRGLFYYGVEPLTYYGHVYLTHISDNVVFDDSYYYMIFSEDETAEYYRYVDDHQTGNAVLDSQCWYRQVVEDDSVAHSNGYYVFYEDVILSVSNNDISEIDLLHG